MSYYDWPNILKKYSDNELKKVVHDKHTEPEEKVSAAVIELNNRGFEINNSTHTIEENYQFNIKDKSVCFYCKSKGLKESEKYCPVCAFPQGGSQIEMKTFILNVKKKKELLEKKKKAINKARIILYVLAGLNLLIGLIIGLIISVNIPVLLSCGIGAVIYLLLGVWCEYQPFPAILSGLFVYLVFNVIAAISDPHTIYQGIIWKVVIISAFIYGYKGVKDSKNLEVELQSINEAKDLSTDK